MKIVLAFDSYKGCLTAIEVCHAAKAALHEVLPQAEILECPLSDGGEGLVDCMEQILPAKRITIKAHDPLMNIIDASYVIDPCFLKEGQDNVSTAYMEMAATSGFHLVPKEKRNPMLTTTYGVGELLIDAVERGCREIVMGIGGSATCDGGKGMLQCLEDNGFIDANGKIANCKLSNCKFTIASDVANPLYGKQGAAYVFAPQKGATPEQVELLDEQLRNFARETENMGLASPALANHPGTGAAGGLGYGLMAYLGAEMKSGIDVILDIKDFDNIIKGADLVITGEGKSDEQTLMGKVPHGVLRHCRKQNIPVWLLSGTIEDSSSTLSSNFSLVKSINEDDPRPLEALMQPETVQENLQKTCMKIIL